MRHPTLDDVWLAFVPLIALFLLMGRSTIPPHDFWWHLRTGQIILESRSIPTVDLFTYTRAGAPWLNQAWLSQVGMYLTYQAGGAPLIIALHAIFVATGYVLTLFAARRASGQTRAAAIATLAVILFSAQGWLPVRPQSISYLLFGALVWIIEADRAGSRRAVWGLPLLFALWANLHGAFIFGLLLSGALRGRTRSRGRWRRAGVWNGATTSCWAWRWLQCWRFR